jgi:hypothetical protein
MTSLIEACTPEILSFVVIGGFGGLRAENAINFFRSTPKKSTSICQRPSDELVSPEATAKFWAIYPNESGKAEIRLSEKLISEGAGTSSDVLE